jgi:hypothetical protein
VTKRSRQSKGLKSSYTNCYTNFWSVRYMSRFNEDYWEKYWERERVFGVPSIFWKIWKKKDRARELKCPRCGKKGQLMQKTTISKKKYKYKKWYVFHARPFETSVRIPKWCYLNKNHLKKPSIQDKIKATKHAIDIERHLLNCIRMRNNNFEL